jgi:hypothetical protein
VIVRILGEGQFEVPEDCVAKLEKLDDDLMKAVDSGDEAAFDAALLKVLAEVRTSCQPIPPEDIRSSDLVLPDSDSTLDDVREMLEGKGILAGGETS